ncbi:suppressor of hpr1 [Dimargaris cristalligena]|uniref:Mediator of RNA polymerase II transcription subunit 31 n=1 Tax=Dimargaris cristalligena TaxID=215637 RepID=A0A4V1J5L7_9FUNG|nr:suppressor of hpr1 [Dimargaris cristalligena]RKP39499.1 SOH1-domain-containing protein [Dimargaris cristalligena]|eukprot:RKP39499.1 SOH1-domain-containing protein [Dimargaris cristalligena]
MAEAQDNSVIPEAPPLVFDPNRERFQIELEFLQCLANPWYLNHLGQLQYFKDPQFVAYLNYLQYWKKPEYAKFIIYPHSLYFLDLLQHAEFREAIAKQDVATYIHQKQYFHWLFFRRGKPLSENPDEEEPSQPVPKP